MGSGFLVLSAGFGSGFEVRGSRFEVRSDYLGEQRIWGDGGGVGGDDGSAGLVVDRHWGQVLDQRAATRSERQPFDVLVLRKIGANAIRGRLRGDVQVPDGLAADVPGSR